MDGIIHGKSECNVASPRPRTAEEWAARASDSCDHIEIEGVCEACLIVVLRAYRLQGVTEALEEAAQTVERDYLGQYPDQDISDDGFMRRQAAAAIRALKGTPT